MHFEVEQKYPLADLTESERRLVALGAGFSSPIEQVDLYLRHPARDFALTDEALRIRSIDDGRQTVVTYKGPKVDAETKTRREIELPLTSEVAKWRDLFAALGFTPVAEVRKRRRVAKLEYDGNEVEAALDEVTDLGSFLELEISANEATVEAAKDTLAALAKELSLGASERRGYLDLLLNRKPPSAVG